MASTRDLIRMKPPPISGGSTGEAELPAVRSGLARATSNARNRRWPRAAPVPAQHYRSGGGGHRPRPRLVAIFADVLAPRDPIASDQTRTFARPSWEYPLGTDQLGRDMLSRVIHGSRISLAVGVSSVLFALLLGVPLGMLAGYTGGWVDTLVMRVMDLILAFPIYLLAIILMVMFTPTAGLLGTMKVTGAIAIVRIPIYARLVRGSVLSIKEKEYVEACRALGVAHPLDHLSSHPAQLPGAHHRDHHARHRYLHHRGGYALLPRARHPAPDAELGLGPQGQHFLHSGQCLAVAFPGLAIFVTVLGFNLFGDGIRDALDPRLK
jgi:peptide/nickel transport system permease protein